MIRLNIRQIHNAYILETLNYDDVKNEIMNMAVSLDFDENLVRNFTHPDIIYIEEKENKIPIDKIRKDVINASILPPLIADRKFFVIYDAINLDVDTQNALLKTLEEPYSFDTFFLVTSNVNKLLETVRSRCIVIKDSGEISANDIVKIEFIDDALNSLANIKYETPSDIMRFAEIFENRDDLFKDLIMIYRYAIRDAYAYKRTLSKDIIRLKEKEAQIVSIANALDYHDLGKYIERLDNLSKTIGLSIDKKLAVYNFFEI